MLARGRVVVADAQACAAGVQVGQKLSTALGLVPGLRVLPRDPAREEQVLQSLACWAGRFTPTLSLAPPAGLLLEIGGCLRLFGGLPALLAAVAADCAAQGWVVCGGLAATPLAARWLAQGGTCIQPASAGETVAWRTQLAALPLAATQWPNEVLARLQSFGLSTLGDLQNLPLAALRARLGNAAVDDWLRAWGEMPDPQAAFIFPEHFSQACELPARVEQAEGLVFAAQRLLAAMCGWLQARQLEVRVCTLHLQHDDGELRALVLRLAEPGSDEGRLLRLLREHLGRWQLHGPVAALRLTADETRPRPGSSVALFAEAKAGEGTAACIERLRARLGEAAVTVPVWQPDYRPECATRDADPLVNGNPASGLGMSPSVCAAGTPVQRPLWLLAQPLALVERADGPYWHGPLQFLTRAERLESGWWDQGEGAGDLRRDYFIVRNRHGQCGWVFRDAGGWFLHGLFA